MTSDRSTFELGNPIDWSPNDLTNTLAVMRRVPSRYLDPLSGVHDEPGFYDYVQTFQDDIIEILGPSTVDDPAGRPRASYYLIPPAAGPYTDFILLIADNINTVVQSIDAYVWIGEALIQLARRRKARDEELDEEFDFGHRSSMYGGLRVLESMCLYHAHSSYYDPSRHPALRIESFSRGEYVGAVDHPTPGVQYTINVRIGVDSYVYVTRADGQVVEHFKVTDGKVTGLSRPNWLEDEIDGPWNEATEASPLLPT